MTKNFFYRDDPINYNMEEQDQNTSSIIIIIWFWIRGKLFVFTILTHKWNNEFKIKLIQLQIQTNAFDWLNEIHITKYKHQVIKSWAQLLNVTELVKT